MLCYSDNKPVGPSPVQVYCCPRCSYVARLDRVAMIPNACPRCREAGRMRYVRAATVGEIEARIGVAAGEWEDMTR